MACSFTTDGAHQGLGKGEATLRLTALVHAVEQSQVSVAMEPAPARTGLARHIIWHSGAHRTVGGEPCRNRRQRLDLNCRPTTIILPSDRSLSIFVLVRRHYNVQMTCGGTPITAPS